MAAISSVDLPDHLVDLVDDLPAVIGTSNEEKIEHILYAWLSEHGYLDHDALAEREREEECVEKRREDGVHCDHDCQSSYMRRPSPPKDGLKDPVVEKHVDPEVAHVSIDGDWEGLQQARRVSSTRKPT